MARRVRLFGLCVLLVMAPGLVQAQAAPSDLEALRREVQSLRALVNAQQGTIAELKAAMARLEQAVAQRSDAPREVTVSIDGQPVRGRPDAPVTVVEFSDFECPFCARFARDVFPAVDRELIATGRVKLIYRDFPLPIHPYAEEAAYAGICADQQGKFWAMHDRMFADQRALDPTSLRQHAKDLGLDSAAFETCMQSDGPKADIERDKRDGVAAGVRGTPAFLIGRTGPGTTVTGELVIGVQSLEAIRAKVEALTKR